MAQEDSKSFNLDKSMEDVKPPLEVSSVTLLANNPLACNMCGKVFTARRELLVHQWSHKERQTFYCPNCEKNFNNENQFKRHMHVHTKEGKKFVTCDICKKVFRNNRTLEEHHVQDHTGQKPYRCGTCGIQFSWRENLRKHLHTHITKPFACTICHESFRDNDSLNAHSKIHKREMKELEKREQERREQEERERRRELHKQMGVFVVGSDIESKIKIEDTDEEDKVFKCAVCFQSFKYAFTLEAHMKGHVEDGVEIKKESDDSSDVKIPEDSPTQNPKITTSNPVFEKPHVCDICHQSFRWGFCLDAHVKIHKQGFDAKLEKEKERKALKKAKEVRKQEALRKASVQDDENGQEKQEGTVVIVVEQFTEEEKRKLATKEQNKKQAVKKPKKRKQTRREAMAEQLPDNELTLENEGGEEEQEDTINQEITFEFSDIVDTDSPCSENKIADSEEEVQCSEAKIPKLTPVPEAIPIKNLTVRGRAKTRGGGHVNHIDLNEVVASIGKETRQNFIRRKGVSTRGGRAGTSSCDRPPYEVKKNESDDEFGLEEGEIALPDDDDDDDDDDEEEDDNNVKEEEMEMDDSEEEQDHSEASGEEEEEVDESVEGADSDVGSEVDEGACGRSESEPDSDQEDDVSDDGDADGSEVGDENRDNSDEEDLDDTNNAADDDDDDHDSDADVHHDGPDEEESDEDEQTDPEVVRKRTDDSDDDDDDDDDDDEIVNDDLDEQELLKLKMKVYSCELCSKAFVQSDLLMEHKVNYHQQNGDGVRNIFSAASKPRPNKVLPSSSNVSSSKRGSR